MAEPTLVQVFGTGAVQDSTSFTVQKAALATVGLTASPNNTAESLFVALVLLAGTELTETNQESRVDQNVTVVDGFPQIIFRNDDNYRQNTKNINIQKLDTNTTIYPDDY